ncbi:MAG TPA: hypothetical protein VF282_02240 [Bacillota bacterium]
MNSIKRENRLVWVFFLVTVLMVNPPILYWLNGWFQARPLLMGWPTLWLYLTFWYVVMLGGFVYFAARLPSWQAELIEEAVKKDE